MRNLILIILILQGLSSNCQNWQLLAPSLDRAVSSVYTDTIENILYIGGVFSQVEGQPTKGVAKWDGLSWSSLAGGGMEDIYSSIYPNTTRAICRYKGYLYFGGSFQAAGGFHSKHLIRWDGNQFDSIPFPNESVIGLKVIDDYLYVCGVFDSIDGKKINSLAKWDGSEWTDVFNFPKFDLNYIVDVLKFENEIYVIGNLSNSLNDPIQNIVKYNGHDWVPVGNGIRGALSSLNSMAIFKDELYVAGEFRKRDGNVGNNIQKWNGSEWLDVGGGFNENGPVRRLLVRNDKLYAVGGFDFAGGVEAKNIAIWDGESWCGLGSKFDVTIGAISFYNDTLIIGGGFWTIDGDSISYLAKWTGGDYVDTCGVITSIEGNTFDNNLRIYPNPSNGLFAVGFNSKSTNSTIEVYNILGKQILSYPVREAGAITKQIDITSFPNGLYLVNVFDGQEYMSGKIINRK